MNPRLDLLHAYPFERLRRLLADVSPGGPEINLGIGEPQHPTPTVVTEAMAASMPLLGKYPPTAGTPAFRKAVVAWLARRYDVAVDESAVLPVAGTREALFAFAQAVLDPADPGVVLLPNPFYQIYEGAALLAGAEPFYVPATDKPDWSTVPTDVWPKVRLAYVCSPGNPTGSALDLDDWNEIFAYADRYGFVIAADECYSEIYNREPPVGVLQAAKELGRSNERLVTFNSLSKRSSAPGLRSGFVAGDPEIVSKFLLYRTYHGSAPSLQVQAASVAAWSDEAHVEESRAKYRAKFADATALGGDSYSPSSPAGGFFLWLEVWEEGGGEAFARGLYEATGVTVLPGAYLGRSVGGSNPGEQNVRIALVPERDVCRAALERIAAYACRGD